MGSNLLCHDSGALTFEESLIWMQDGNIYTGQSDAVSYGIDSAETLVSSFSTQGSLYSPNSSAESVNKLVHTSGTAAAF